MNKYSVTPDFDYNKYDIRTRIRILIPKLLTCYSLNKRKFDLRFLFRVMIQLQTLVQTYFVQIDVA